MANIIRKAANTVAVKTQGENIISAFFKNCSLSYFQQKYYNGFYGEHYDAVKAIISVFADLHKNHVILHAPTQSGKTTVMSMLYNVVSESFMRDILGIKRVIYMTGDNQIALSDQNMERFCNHCHFTDFPIRLSGKVNCKAEDFSDTEDKWLKKNRIPFIMIKNQDCRKFKGILGSLNNTLIMLDESHYGTKEINSQVNKLLQNFGKDFSGDPKKLVKHNTYILSVSATPYNEEYADKVNNGENLLKGIVYYKVGKGYIGFSDLYNRGMVEGKKNNTDITDIDKFKEFLKSQREKMDAIYNETKKRCAIIMRMQGTKTVLTEHGEKGLSKITDEYGFKLNVLESKGIKNIDYDGAYKQIEYSQFEGGENALIVVKQGFSYGISIPDDIKPLIATIYDYRPSFANTTTDSTEQGLLGRMTGYHPNELNKHLKIYISEEHLDGLWGYHIHIPPSDSPMPSKKRGGKEECEFDEWDNATYHATDKKTKEEVKVSYIELWNNDKRKPLIFNGETVDSFFNKHDDFNYDELFDTKGRAKVGTIAPIADAFNKEVLKGRFDIGLLVDARRHVGNNSESDKISAALGYVTPILSNASRKGWRTVENGKSHKEGWAFVIDIRKRNGKKGIEIRIPYGHIGFSKDVKEYKVRQNCKGYQKYQKRELEAAMAEA